MDNLARALSAPNSGRSSVFLWGPRKTGKSHWIRSQLGLGQDIWLIDLLQSEHYGDYLGRPELLRERYLQRENKPSWVVIDEVQRIPDLLNEVHWLIENAQARFFLTGSSARKLRRGQANLLGGRAWRREMKPLCLHELDTSALSIEKLESLCVSGLLPPHYLSDRPEEVLRGYVSDYLKEEIAAEAAVRNLQTFSLFLKVAGLTSGELLNFENIAREVGASAKVVRSYFEVLDDTLIGMQLPAYRRSPSRRMSLTNKFYLFDLGLSNCLARRKPTQGTPEFGKSFEHLVWMELCAYRAYKDPDLELSFWRTNSGLEVDFLLNDLEVAIEVKSGKVHMTDLKGLTALASDSPVGLRLVVSLERESRVVEDRFGPIKILTLQDFVSWLWTRPPGY